MLCRDVLYIAFREARILQRPQALCSDSELQDGMIFGNQQIDYWAARACYAYTTSFDEYPLPPNHQPVLIGPGVSPPDIVVPQRPVAIESASIILNGTTDVGLNLRDAAWWAGLSQKNQTSTQPTDLTYDAQFPNGELWLWPIPTGAHGLRLETRVVLQQFADLDDPFLAPPAYLAGFTLTLAEELCDVWGVPQPPTLQRRAMKARDALQVNNNLPERISSADSGTSCRCGGSDFNWMTGQKA